MIYKIALCIPTYNAAKLWPIVLNAISIQNLELTEKVIIDSNSKDDTVSLAIENGFKVISIEPNEFDHGKSRQMLIDYCPDVDIHIFITQDTILADPNSLNKLVKAFQNESVGLAYGRQLPHQHAKVLESHARLFNYSDNSQLRGSSDISRYGFKTIFCSNSFAAYRTKALQEVGGFPVNNIMGEDTIVAAKLIEQGWKIAYVSDAQVLHSHSYTLIQEFKRYFDTGVFHAQNIELYNKFGKPTGEGVRFVLSEFNYSIRKSMGAVFSIFPKTVMKFIGFKLGLMYKRLPFNLVKSFSMHKFYWEKHINN